MLDLVEVPLRLFLDLPDFVQVVAVAANIALDFFHDLQVLLLLFLELSLGEMGLPAVSACGTFP